MKSGDFMQMSGYQAWKPQVTQPISVGELWGLEHLRQRGDAPQSERIGRSRGKTPRSNVAQNEQFKAVVKKYKLTKKEADILHDRISKEGLGYREMEEVVITEFKSNGRW